MDKEKIIKEAVIPDYDFLFNETDKINKKVNFIGKIMRLNIVPIFLSIFLYILQALPIFVTPVLTAEIIDVVTFAVQNDAVNYEMWKTIIIYGSIIIGLTLFNVPMTMLRFRVVSTTVRRTGSGIKCSVVRKLQSLSLTYHKELQTGKVQAKFLKDTDEVDNFYSLFMHNIIPMSLSVIVWFSISVYRNWIVALFFLLIVPINVVLGLTFRKKIRKRFFELRVDTENMSTKLHTMLEMLPVTKAHGLESEELKQVKSSIKEVQGSGIAVDRTIGNFGAWQWVVPACLSAICLLFCSTLAILGKISVGEIVLFQSLFSSLSGYLSNLVSCLPSIGKGAEALRSISEIMNVTEVENNIGKKHVPSIEGSIEFNHVHYTYPRTNVEVVTDFCLKVKKRRVHSRGWQFR